MMADLVTIQTICLADRLAAMSFKKTLHNTYVNVCLGMDGYGPVSSPSYASVIYAFQHLPQDDLLLKLQVHEQSYHWTEGDDTDENGDRELLKELPRDFLCAVMKKMSHLRSKDDAHKELYPCDYHLHDDEEEKTRCPDYREQKGMEPYESDSSSDDE
jgi:hypothetical protein